MALTFPASPSENDTHTEGSITYKWDGAKWIGLGLTPSDRLVDGSNNLEINSSNNLIWTGGNVGIGGDPLRKLDVIGNSILVRPNTITSLDSSGNADAVNNSIIVRCPYGENAATVSNAGNRFGIQFTGANNTVDVPSLNFGDDPFKSASIYGVSEDSGAGYSRKVGMAFYTSNFDVAQTEQLRITGEGNVIIGHTAANAKLQINNGTNSAVSNSTNPAFQIGGTGNYRFGVYTTNEQGIIANKNGDDGIAFHTKTGKLDGTFGEAVRIDSNGNVGVGSDNPSQPMTLKRSSSGQGEFGYRFEFEDTDGPTQTSSAILVGDYGLKLKNYNSGRNFIFETGSVLMGGVTVLDTSVDTSKLCVEGGDSNIGIIQVHAGGGEFSGDLSGIAFSHGAAGTSARAKCAIASRATGAYGKGHMIFCVDGANDNGQVSDADEKMRISTDGSVTKPDNALIRTSGSTSFGSVGSLTTNTANVGISQGDAAINKGSTGWSTSGSNAYTFVCPVDGIYVVHAHVEYGNIGGGRKIWVMSYTLGGGNLPLDAYVEVMDHASQDYANFSYYNTYEFTAGTRVGMGRNGGSGSIAGQTFSWGIHLLQ